MKYNNFYGVLSILLLFSSPLQALVSGSLKSVMQNSPQQIKMGIFISDISKINLIEGESEVDFYLNLNCTPTCTGSNIELVNGKFITKEEIVRTATHVLYKFEALLDHKLDFKKYPFDSQKIKIVLTNKNTDYQESQLLVDPRNSGIDKEIVLLGWNDSPKSRAEVLVSNYPINPKQSPRYVFTITIDRPYLAGFLKTILPGIFIMIIGFLPLFLRSKVIINGLTLASGAFISMILLHLSITSSLPFLQYMTFIDSFMITNYLGLFMVLTEMIVLMRLPSNKAEKLEKIFFFFTVSIWLIMQLINIFQFLK